VENGTLQSSRIERIVKPDAQTVLREIARRHAPFIVTDVVTGWRSFTAWSLAHLEERVGDRMVSVAASPTKVFHYGSKDFSRMQTREMRFRDVIRHIAAAADQSGERLYIMEQQQAGRRLSFAEAYPELADDLVLPPGIETGELLQVNLWVGEAGNVTPLHFDIENNFLAQIIGRKRVTLFDPGQTGYLYPNGSRSCLNNTSQVQLLAPDFDRHPRFRQARGVECIVNAGEMLFIPPFWWHQVESLDPAVSINFWWKPQFEQWLNPMGIQLLYRRYDLGTLAGLCSEVSVEFADFARLAAHCLERGHKCLAVLLAKTDLEARCHEQPALVEAAMDSWGDVLVKAASGNDAELHESQVAVVLESLADVPRVAPVQARDVGIDKLQ